MIQNPITRLIEQLNSKEYHVRYPQLLDKSAKTHVLFLGPYINATGLYRTMIPYWELNKSQTHSAIINQLIPNTEKNRTGNTNWSVSDEMIQWADLIVFPTVTSNLSEPIKLLRQINKKPHLKFVFDIDDNYHIDEPGQNVQERKEKRLNIINNMAMCNVVTCTNSFLGNYYLHIMQKNALKLPVFLVMPNFMHSIYLENIKITQPKSSKKRILIQLSKTQNHMNDALSIRNVLLQIQKKYTDKIEIVLFGFNGKIVEKNIVKDAFRGIKYTHVPPVEIHQYFNTLINLQIDFALMPMLTNDFNASKSHHKLLQYAQAGIPAIVSDTLPYKEIISPDGQSMFESGFLPVLKCKKEEDWIKNIDFLMENENSLKNISTKAKHSVNQYFTWENKPNYICNVYK